MSNFKLQSFDGEVFKVNAEILRFSGTLSTMLDRISGQQHADEVIPLPNVSSAILYKILQWANYHQNDIALSENELHNDICVWDAEFLNVDQGTLFELLQAVHYLDMKALENLICQHIANMLKNKTPETVRHIFHVQNDFTAHEELNLFRTVPYDLESID